VRQMLQNSEQAAQLAKQTADLCASKTHWMVLYASSDRYSGSISQHCMEVKYVMRIEDSSFRID